MGSRIAVVVALGRKGADGRLVARFYAHGRWEAASGPVGVGEYCDIFGFSSGRVKTGYPGRSGFRSQDAMAASVDEEVLSIGACLFAFVPTSIWEQMA